MMTELHSPDSHHPKHIDYILQVNLITAMVLLRVGKLKQALDFIAIAEKMVHLLVKYNVQNKNPPQVQAYWDNLQQIEEQIEEEDKPYEIEIFDH